MEYKTLLNAYLVLKKEVDGLKKIIGGNKECSPEWQQRIVWLEQRLKSQQDINIEKLEKKSGQNKQETQGYTVEELTEFANREGTNPLHKQWALNEIEGITSNG